MSSSWLCASRSVVGFGLQGLYNLSLISLDVLECFLNIFDALESYLDSFGYMATPVDFTW